MEPKRANLKSGLRIPPDGGLDFFLPSRAAFWSNLHFGVCVQGERTLPCRPCTAAAAGGDELSDLPSMQEARQLRTSGMDANQMYEEVRAIAGESAATPLSRGPQRSSHEASEVRRAPATHPPPHPATPSARRRPRRATPPHHANPAPLATPRCRSLRHHPRPPAPLRRERCRRSRRTCCPRAAASRAETATAPACRRRASPG